jgi:hypothetical protein
MITVGFGQRDILVERPSYPTDGKVCWPSELQEPCGILAEYFLLRVLVDHCVLHFC